MNKTAYHSSIIDYYEKAEISYKDVWDLNHSMAFHCGFWEKGITSIRQALLHQNDVMAVWAGITSQHDVLDAGCGIGGSAIYLSKNYGCKTTGISIVPHQIKQAETKSKEHGVEELANFIVADYCDTPFEDNTFDVVWAIESVCYVPDKSDFIKEAYRILKPDGKLIVADGYRLDKPLTDKEELIMKRWEEGYAVERLGVASEFNESLTRLGFAGITIKDATNLVMPSARRLYYFGLAAHYYRKLLKLFGKQYGNEITIKNTQAAINQYLGLKKGLWKYLVFIAEKEK